MKRPTISAGVVHTVPRALRETLLGGPAVLETWNGLTPLARNEWICRVTIVKTARKRQEHLKRLSEDLRKGKRRPCCWPGCPHRRPSAKKWFNPDFAMQNPPRPLGLGQPIKPRRGLIATVEVNPDFILPWPWPARTRHNLVHKFIDDIAACIEKSGFK